MSTLAMIDPSAWIRLSPLADDDRAALDTLVQRLRARDLALIERIIRELVPVVRRTVHRLLGPNREREDAVQDALAEIASALHRFEGRSSISTLAQRITVRTTARHFRRKANEIGDPDLDTHADAEGASPEQQVSNRQRLARLYQHLDALSEPRRTAFVLCALEEMTPTEAADIAMCSAVAMRSRLFEARRELEARLAKDAALADRRKGAR
jgi:RNA polymerase sigma-70 factor (ECF subfamily)